MQGTMPGRRGRWIAGAGVVLAAAFSMACDDEITDQLVDVETTEVVMLNAPSNGLPIHILGPQEGFDPSNRLEPGQNRQTTVRGNQNVQFRAGRNGTVLATTVCDFIGPGELIVWEDGRLFCED